MTVNEPESYTLQAIPQPETYASAQSTPLSDKTLRERLKRVLQGMRQQGLDALLIYADKEHGGNFEYLSGFIPRFEEALPIVAKNGAATYVMGNENFKLVPHARLPGAVLHAPLFLTARSTHAARFRSHHAACAVRHSALPASRHCWLETPDVKRVFRPGYV